MSYDLQDDRVRPPLYVNNSNSNINYTIGGGNIVNHSVNNNYIAPQKVEPDIAKVENALKQHHVPGAAVEAQPEDAGCMPGTRVKLLGDVLVLLKSHAFPHIVWIAGMAGTGKTSIANTLCSMIWMDPMVYLGGSFFCSRSAGSVERTDVKRIVPTLATLLARQFPAFASSLAKQLSETPDVAHWSVQSQVDRLIVQPLNELAQDTYTGQLVFVIDALDECNNSSLLSELINHIADFECKLPVKFLLTSRPEMHIRTTPINDPVFSSILSLHTVDPEQVNKDIRFYICTKLERAFKATPWCFDNEVEALVTLSGGLFIFASTVLKYVFNRGNDSGWRERLQKTTSAVIYSTVATKPLDQIYELVIAEASQTDQVDTDELERMRKILACILTARASLSVQALADLVGSSSDTLRGSLERLHALVHLPDSDTESGVRTLHASFGDYMLGRAANHIRLDPTLGHDLLAAGCMRRMSWSDLRFNISRSRSSYEPNAIFQPDSISLSLVYACLHWAHHIDGASTRSAFDEMVGGTFRRKFLFWLEVLSIMGNMTVASGLLRIAGSAVNSQDTAQFLDDANSFVASSFAAITCSAPHIYLSAVPFASKDSVVYLDFAPMCTGVVSVETYGTDHHASRLVMTLGHKYNVTSVAYSLSGRLIASGLSNGIVHIWDTRTGEEFVSPIRGADGAVFSVVFSPDGQLVASGAENGIISVWSVATGRLKFRRPLAHSGPVELIAFSPNGKLIASTGRDNTVGLWNMETSQIVSAPSDYGNAISLSFSSDGVNLILRFLDEELWWHTGVPRPELQLQLLSHRDQDALGYPSPSDSLKLSLDWDRNTGLISISRAGKVSKSSCPLIDPYRFFISPDERFIAAIDNTGDASLHLWDLRCIDADPSYIILRGHGDPLNTISFSPDCRYLASGSGDCSIRIWDACSAHKTVQHIQEIGVTAVAVSPDMTFIACGRGDGSMYVHDLTTGEARLPLLIGHEGQVFSVAISPDGKIIASGSVDCTIRLWDAQTGATIGDPLSGHQDWVLNVAFSPNMRFLASGSSDKTVFIWNVGIGKPLDIAPMLCEHFVSKVAFLPSGQVVAAGDSQGNIYLWHSETGQLVHQLQLVGLRPLAFSPGTSRLLLMSELERIVCDVNTGEELHSFDEAYGWNCSGAWSPCERYIAVTSMGQSVYLYDLEQDTVARLQGHKPGYTGSVAFASNGRFVVSGAHDGIIRVWDVEDALSLVSRANHDPVARIANAEFRDGWLIGPSGELLLWVPADYYGYLQFPPHKATILGHRRIVVTVGNSDMHWGESWHTCWRDPIA